MALVGGAVAAVDALEVRDHAREIQFPLRRQELGQANVLDVWDTMDAFATAVSIGVDKFRSSPGVMDN